MNCRSTAVGLSLVSLLSLVAGQANCAATQTAAQPLQLALAPSYSAPIRERPRQEIPESTTRIAVAPTRRSAISAETQKNFRQRALQTLLDGPDPSLDSARVNTGQPLVGFRFERQGPAIRDFSRSYKNLCNKVSSKLWDEPNGRRIRFDIAGKPGVAIEIPVH
jgi:hypothetical protein